MELRHRYNLQDLLDYLELPRSAFYYHLQQQGKEDKNKAPKEEIWSIYTEHKTYYGYRRVHLEVLNRGWGCKQEGGAALDAENGIAREEDRKSVV